MIVSGIPIRETTTDTLRKRDAVENGKTEDKSEDESYIGFRIFFSFLNTIVHCLLMVSVVICLWYAFRRLPMNETQQHVAFCVLGYQLFMIEAILTFSNDNTWSSFLKLRHRKLIHWILQIIGFILGITGVFIKSLSKERNFNTNHGKLALCVTFLSSVSILNGIAAFFSYDLRTFVPVSINKISHIVIGITTMILSTATLCLGIDKNAFRIWSQDSVADMLIVFNVVIIFIVIINPFQSTRKKLESILKS